MHGTWFEDELNVHPNTLYEYSLQLKRDEELGIPSAPFSVETAGVPTTSERLPLSIFDLDATATSEGVRVSWMLPPDPTVERIEVEVRDEDGHYFDHSKPTYVLGPSSTAIVDRSGNRGSDSCYRVRTVNRQGISNLSWQRSCVDSAEMIHCVSYHGSIADSRYWDRVLVISGGCEVAEVNATRYELTRDGLNVVEIGQPCDRSGLIHPQHIGTLQCDFADYDVERDTWYIYEIRQTFADGRRQVQHFEILTGPALVNP